MLLFLFSIWGMTVQGQAPYTHVEGGAHLGYIWPHHPDLDNLYSGGFPLVQISLGRQTRGDKLWHHAYNFPETGFTLMYSSLGYPQVLGHAFGAFPHINLPLYERNGIYLQLRYGLGLAYLTNRYRVPQNTGNLAISTSLNIIMNTALQVSLPLTGKLSIRGGISLTHFSNGRIRVPNKGLNIPSVKLDLVRVLHDPRPLPERLKTPKTFSRYSFQIFGAGGYRTLYSTGDKLYAEFTLSAIVSRHLSMKSSLGLGSDLFLSFSDKAILEQQQQESIPLYSFWKPGIHISYELVFGNSAMILQQGIYLHAAYAGDGPAYNRFGLRHKISTRWLLNLTLKSHFFQANYLEWGLGYQIL